MGKWDCGDGYCINADWVCDGTKDCNEGEDEANCGSGNEGEDDCDFLCDDGQCLTLDKVCNGFDECFGAEDEKGCGEIEGGESSSCDFQCNNTECIPQAWVCDGEEDCNSGEDEELCDTTGEEGGGSTIASSCEGYCGVSTKTPGGCYCDDNCAIAGDCCDDICIWCTGIVDMCGEFSP